MANQKYAQEEQKFKLPLNERGQYDDSQNSHYDQYAENSQPQELQLPEPSTPNFVGLVDRLKTEGEGLTNLIGEINDGQEIDIIMARLKDFHDKVTNPGTDLQAMVTQCF